MEPEFQAWQRGDDAVFDRLVARWERPLFAFAWRYLHNRADAQDVVAETFVRLHQRRARLRPDTNLSALLFTTLANLCHNRARWRRRHPDWESTATPAEGEELLERQRDENPDARSLLEQAESVQALKTAVDRLPHHLKTVVLLHYMDGLSYQEIAASVGCSPRGVETRLYRARRRLRKHLAPEVEDTATADAPKRKDDGGSPTPLVTTRHARSAHR